MAGSLSFSFGLGFKGLASDNTKTFIKMPSADQKKKKLRAFELKMHEYCSHYPYVAI